MRLPPPALGIANTIGRRGSIYVSHRSVTCRFRSWRDLQTSLVGIPGPTNEDQLVHPNLGHQRIILRSFPRRRIPEGSTPSDNWCKFTSRGLGLLILDHTRQRLRRGLVEIFRSLETTTTRKDALSNNCFAPPKIVFAPTGLPLLPIQSQSPSHGFAQHWTFQLQPTSATSAINMPMATGCPVQSASAMATRP